MQGYFNGRGERHDPFAVRTPVEAFELGVGTADEVQHGGVIEVPHHVLVGQQRDADGAQAHGREPHVTAEHEAGADGVLRDGRQGEGGEEEDEGGELGCTFMPLPFSGRGYRPAVDTQPHP